MLRQVQLRTQDSQATKTFHPVSLQKQSQDRKTVILAAQMLYQES